MAQLALADGLPGDARKTIEQGYATGALGSGTAAARQNRLRDLATRSATRDQKELAHNEAEAGGQRDGAGLVEIGLDYIGYGQLDKGAALVKAGLERGHLKHPEDAQLRLGVAYLLAGQKANGLQLLNTVQGADGAADLAHLWVIFARQPG